MNYDAKDKTEGFDVRLGKLIAEQARDAKQWIIRPFIIKPTRLTRYLKGAKTSRDYRNAFIRYCDDLGLKRPFIAQIFGVGKDTVYRILYVGVKKSSSVTQKENAIFDIQDVKEDRR